MGKYSKTMSSLCVFLSGRGLPMRFLGAAAAVVCLSMAGLCAGQDAKVSIKNAPAQELTVGSYSQQNLVLASAFAEAAPVQNSEGESSVKRDSKQRPVLEEVVVTARKRSESLIDVPVSITSLDQESLKTFNIETFSDYATRIPTLAYSYGQVGVGPGVSGSGSLSIRGVNGLNTNGFYIDDTPVPPSIDPRVVDIERIEALKGPQGTLYGAASMGGNVRLVTRKPELESSEGSYLVQGGDTSGGGADYGANTIANIAAIPGSLGVRAMLYYQHDAGFLTNVFPGGKLANQGAIESYGGSISARWKASESLDVTFRFLGQQMHYYGLPEAYAPLPHFTPDSYILNRSVDLAEGAANNFTLTSLDLEYRAKSFTFTSSTSFFYNYDYEKENNTEATVQIFADALNVKLDPTIPVPYSGSGSTNQLTEEARLSATFTDNLSMITGVYYTHQWMPGTFDPVHVPELVTSGLYPTDLLFLNSVHNEEDSAAVFGELYYQFLQKFNLTLGGRGYYLKQQGQVISDGFFTGGYTVSPKIDAHESGFSPKVALSYALSHDSNLYASFSEGFRPGGPQSPLPAICDSGLASVGLSPEDVTQYKPDKVETTEVGFKSALSEGRAYISTAVFQTNWKDMQQLVILPCSLAVTANTGEARIRGAEFELNGEIFPRFQMRFGLGFLHATIIDKGHAATIFNGERIPQTPDFTGTVGVAYTFGKVGAVTPFATADYSYVGDRISTNNGPQPITVPAYSVLNMSLGVDWGNSNLRLYAKNVSNAKPNLGDIAQQGFNQTTVLNGQTVPYAEVRVLAPFSMGLQFTHHF